MTKHSFLFLSLPISHTYKRTPNATTHIHIHPLTIHTHPYTHIHTLTRIQAHPHSSTHTSSHLPTSTNIPIHLHTTAHTYIHTHPQTSTPTHPHQRWLTRRGGFSHRDIRCWRRRWSGTDFPDSSRMRARRCCTGLRRFRWPSRPSGRTTRGCRSPAGSCKRLKKSHLASNETRWKWIRWFHPNALIF